MERARPRTQGIPSRAHRSASQGPRADPFRANDEVLLIRREGLENRCGSGLHRAVPHDLPAPLQDSEVHGAGVQGNATLKLVRLSVESPAVSSSPEGGFPSPSSPTWAAAEGASSSFTGMQPTANSVRYAPAAHRA
jgi:hypothetical protein